MVKYRAAIWSFLKLTALYFTMSDIVHTAWNANDVMYLGCLLSILGNFRPNVSGGSSSLPPHAYRASGMSEKLRDTKQ